MLTRLSSAALRAPTRTPSRALSSLVTRLDGELQGIRDAGLWKTERVVTTKQSSKISVANNDDKVLNFCANNYLGLSSHPRIIEAAKKALDERGFGLSSVRFICGTQDIHKELEAAISEFHGTEDTILYPSCFDANAGTSSHTNVLIYILTHTYAHTYIFSYIHSYLILRYVRTTLGSR